MTFRSFNTTFDPSHRVCLSRNVEGLLRIVNGVWFCPRFQIRYRDHFHPFSDLETSTQWMHSHLIGERNKRLMASCDYWRTLKKVVEMVQQLKFSALSPQANGCNLVHCRWSISPSQMLCSILTGTSGNIPMDQFHSYDAILFPSDGMTILGQIPAVYSHVFIEGRPPSIVQLMTRWAHDFQL
jgi:hypothetical protein